MSIEADTPQQPVFHRLPVSEIIDESPDARSLVFSLTPSQRERLSYSPGQFVTVRVPLPDGSLARCYSLASSPHVDVDLKVTVKRIGDGACSNWRCDRMRYGDTLDVLEPSGIVTPSSVDERFLLFAGGSGITPLMSIIKSVLHAGTGTIRLCFANRDGSAVIFDDELSRLEAAYPQRFSVLHWLESCRGLPTADDLRELVNSGRFTTAFVCGPKPFMRLARSALRDVGFPRESTHVERFASLGGDPFADAVPASGTEGDSSTAEVATYAVGDGADEVAGSGNAGDVPRLEIEMNGARHAFAWPQDTRLLDLLVRNGLDAPSSCGEGVCAACECRVLEGAVDMVSNQVLDEQDLAEGYVLACQAVPASDKVRLSYG